MLTPNKETIIFISLLHSFKVANFSPYIFIKSLIFLSFYQNLEYLVKKFQNYRLFSLYLHFAVLTVYLTI